VSRIRVGRASTRDQTPDSQRDAHCTGDTTAHEAFVAPGRWTELALCAQADPDAWFPERGRIAAMAKSICGACPVRAQCLDYALSGADTWHGISTGIWGGTTPRERAILRRARKAAAA
jgi:WhiB family transcriptional regulator, redox-sensing transcriptional regulator